MRIRALDNSHDWMMGRGRSDYQVDINAVGEEIETRLLSWKNDCFFDLNSGLNYNQFLGSFANFNQREFEQAVAETIQKTPGVISLDSLTTSLNRETRTISFTANVTTQYGKLTTNLSV